MKRQEGTLCLIEAQHDFNRVASRMAFTGPDHRTAAAKWSNTEVVGLMALEGLKDPSNVDIHSFEARYLPLTVDDTASEYQGWVNRETWVVALHLGNTAEWHKAAHAIANQRAARLSDHEKAEQLREFVETLSRTNGWAYFPNTPLGNFHRDAINTCLALVEWVDIVRHMKED